jgi:hypothetical protein
VAACHAKGISPADVVVSMRLTWTQSVEIDADRGAPLLFFKSGHVGCLLFGGADWLHQRRHLFKPHRQVEEKSKFSFRSTHRPPTARPAK